MTTNMFEGQGTGLTQLASGNPDRPYDEINISKREFWATTMAEREETFAVLRRERPITWQPPLEENLLPVDDDYGYWAVTTYRHLVEVTKRCLVTDLEAAGGYGVRSAAEGDVVQVRDACGGGFESCGRAAVVTQDLPAFQSGQ